jgi:REP element-mobilizing transposase RayT
MYAFVVMPEHVHLLLTPLLDDVGDPYWLVEILQSLKGSSAHTVNKALHRSGPVWQEESFDHLLRRNEEFSATVEYVRQNPVRRGLVPIPENYRWFWIREPGQ